MHESFEAPAAIADWATLRGHEVSYTRLYQYESFPQEIDFDFLIVMGGPQSPTTPKEECPYFDGELEKAFVKKAIDADIYVLGVCLGAQFIGEALGAPVLRSPQREIGVFPIVLTDEGKSDPIFSSFPETFSVGHWHGDMPGLTENAAVLAVSEGCPRQIVRYTPKVYGFQCHFEFTRDAIEGMIEHNAHELEHYKGLPYIQTAEQLRKEEYREMNAHLFAFLDALTTR